MSEPLVCAIMLTRDRPEMAARAVRSFREQTYRRKQLLIYNTGRELLINLYPKENQVVESLHCSIGELRNAAVLYCGADIIMHMDDDDVSHPNRIAEQVAFLQSSGADVVGYDEVLFWREGASYLRNSEAWLWSNNCVPNRHAPGTSLCYWRKYWERHPFADLPTNSESTSEYHKFLQDAKLATMTSLTGRGDSIAGDYDVQPRIVASIHGSNTVRYDDIERSQNWRRVPEWDTYCRERMAL